MDTVFLQGCAPDRVLNLRHSDSESVILDEEEPRNRERLYSTDW